MDYLRTQLLIEQNAASSYLDEFYTNRKSWFLEYTGYLYHPQQKSHSDSISLYMYREYLNKYNLNVLVAALVTGDPQLVYLEGTEDKTHECTYNRGRGPEGEDFFVCRCAIRPRQGVAGCAMIVDSLAEVQYAYKLLKWNYAK